MSQERVPVTIGGQPGLMWREGDDVVIALRTGQVTRYRNPSVKDMRWSVPEGNKTVIVENTQVPFDQVGLFRDE